MGKLTPKGSGFDPDDPTIILGEQDRNRQPRTGLPGKIYIDGQYVRPCDYIGGHTWSVDAVKGTWLCNQCGFVPPAFVADITVDKKRTRIFNDSLGVRLTSYSQALHTLQQIRQELEAGEFDPKRYCKRSAQELFFGTLIDELFGIKTTNKRLAPAYIKDYKRYCEEHKAYFGGKRVALIKTADIDKYEGRLRTTHPEWSATYLQRYMDHLKSVFIWLRDDKKAIKEKDMPKFVRVKAMSPEKPQGSVYMAPPAQAAALALIPVDMDRQIVKFLMLHGRRPSEACALKKKCIDPFAKTITFSEHYSGWHLSPGVKSRLETQTIPMHPDMQDWLIDRWKPLDDPEDFIFVNPRGRAQKHEGCVDDGRRPYHAGAVRRLWQRVRDAGNIPQSMRLQDATRHSAGTQLSQAGMSAKSIASILGNTPETAAKHYIHNDLEHARQCLTTLSVDTQSVSKLSVAKKAGSGSGE